MSGYVTRLKKEIASLQTEREYAFMRDDFAITNGTIRQIDREIHRLKELVAEAERAIDEMAA